MIYGVQGQDDRVPSLVVSLILIATGAILVWGVSADAEGIDIDAVGVILMVVGLVAFLISLVWWADWWRPPRYRERYVEDAPPRRAYARRRETIVDEDAGPPPGPPGPPP